MNGLNHGEHGDTENGLRVTDKRYLGMELFGGVDRMKGMNMQTRKEYAPLPPELSALSGEVIDAAIKVHRHLGPGLLESVYERCLCHELLCRGIPFKSQLAIPILYEGIVIDSGLRIDLVVDGKLIVELKAVERLIPLHASQILTYLKLSSLRLGLLLNFNVPVLRDGIKRLAL